MRERVVAGFLEWAAVRGGLDSEEQAGQSRDRLELLLRTRANFLGKPDPTRWRSGDVHELLMDYVVPRQVDFWGLAGHGVPTMRDFLLFLDETDRLHPASARVPALLRELDRLAPTYPAAMADSSRYWLAKRVFTGMAAEGVDVADKVAVDAWAVAFSARDADGRREVLGHLMDRDPGYATGALLIHDGEVAILRPGMPADKAAVWPDECICGCAHPAYPAVGLPPQPELAAAVADGGDGLLRRLARLAAWAGPEGRPVNKRGELAKQEVHSAAEAVDLPVEGVRVLWDLPPLSQLWRLAIEFDVLRLYRTRIVPGPGAALLATALRADGPADEVLELWSGMFAEIVSPTPSADPPKAAHPTPTWMRLWPPRFLVLLYARCPNGGSADLNELIADLLTQEAASVPDEATEAFASLAAAVVIAKTLADLAEHGAVIIVGHLGPTLPPGAARAASAPGAASSVLRLAPGNAQVQLTDLGRYAIRQRLLAEGAEAPVVALAAS